MLCCETLHPTANSVFFYNISFSPALPLDTVYLNRLPLFCMRPLFVLWSGLNFHVYLQDAAHPPTVEGISAAILT